MALLKAPSRQPKTTTLQMCLEEEVMHNPYRYAELIGANPSYVASEALKLLSSKHEARNPGARQPTIDPNPEQNEGDAIAKTA